MKLIPLLAVAIFFFGCTSRPGEKKTSFMSQLVSLTDNEEKAIKEIIAYYGGRCAYGFEKNIQSGKKNSTTFWIKLSQSALVDSLAPAAELPGSNIAYLFYKNLKEEKSNYQRIKTELIFSSGKLMGFQYPPSQLEKVKAKMPVIQSIVSLIKARDFEGLKNHIMIDSAIIQFDVNKVIANIQQAEQQFGDVITFIPFGFKFITAKNGKAVLHLSGLVTRQQQNTRISVDLDPDSPGDKIYLMDYQF